MEKNKIRNMADLQAETSRVRKVLRYQEQGLSEDFWQMVDSITPMRIISGITGRILSSAPTILAAFQVIRTIFGKKK